MLKTLVFNGWAAGPEAWNLCTFAPDWIFDYVEQLDGLPERVIDDSDEVVLVGWSMGGSTALRMLLRASAKVRGLVLVAATPRMMEEREGASDGRGRVLWEGMSPRREAALARGTELQFANDPSPVYAAANRARGLDYLRRTDLRDELRRRADEFRALPVAILQSERDGIVRPANALFLKEIFPQAMLTWIPGAEHVLPVKAPERLSAAVTHVICRAGTVGRP